MALTPDDVVEKVFPTVRFKDGYDPDEIDDYLDEVVIEWRKALEENASLKERIAELEAAAGVAPVSAVPAAAVPAEQPAPAEPASSAASDVEQVARIITTAQRVHDEIISEGEAKRDELISDAETKAAQILTEVEARKRDEVQRLTTERDSLQGKIDELREFESSYRSHLRTYFEGQLNQLNSEPPHEGAVADSGQ